MPLLAERWVVMSDEKIEEARRRWAASMRESNEQYRTLLLESNAPADLIAELDRFETPLDVKPPNPVLPLHPPTSPDPTLCRDLLQALNELRARFVERAATHAAPGYGQEELSFLHVDEAIHHAGLMDEIVRLERSMETAGCRI